MPNFSGIVRATSEVARFETATGTLTLDPYPERAAITANRRKEVGVDLFGYLDGHQIKVAGTRVGEKIYNAHLVVPTRQAFEDVQIAPGSADQFATEIGEYFQKDSSEVAAKLNNVGIRTASALYHRINNNYDEEVRAFAQYLKISKERIRHFHEKMKTDRSNQALVQASPRFPVRRGVNLNLLAKARVGVPVEKKATGAPPPFPPAAATPHLPSSVDLAIHATPVRDQGMRGTCVAHTALACLEGALVRAGRSKRTLNLSEQYLYWGASC